MEQIKEVKSFNRNFHKSNFNENYIIYPKKISLIFIYNVLCNSAAFIPELSRADKHDEDNLEGRQVTHGGRHQTDEENLEGPQVTHGGRHQTDKCLHARAHTSHCLAKK